MTYTLPYRDPYHSDSASQLQLQDHNETCKTAQSIIVPSSYSKQLDLDAPVILDCFVQLVSVKSEKSAVLGFQVFCLHWQQVATLVLL